MLFRSGHGRDSGWTWDPPTRPAAASASRTAAATAAASVMGPLWVTPTTVACLALCTVQDDLRAGALVRLSISGRPLDSFELRCAYRDPLPEVARRFMDHLREQLNAPSPA